MKKLLSIAAVLSVLALGATPALAGFEKPPVKKECPKKEHPKAEKKCCPETKVTAVNKAKVHNAIKSLSNSGKNLIKVKGEVKQDPSIETGDATADAVADTSANNNEVDVTTPEEGKLEVQVTNDADVHNYVKAVANTGLNKIEVDGDDTDAPISIKTGNASSSAFATNLLNSNVVTIK